MATDYAGAVRNGAMAAARLHVECGTQAKMQRQGGGIDVFYAVLGVHLPLLLRPLDGLLGAYLPDPIPGVLVTTERPLSIQRFTAAHELGHFRLKHRPSLDDENNILRRMTMTATPTAADPDMQEVEADAFAVGFLIAALAHRLALPPTGLAGFGPAKASCRVSTSLRLGASYEATTWTLQRYNLIAGEAGRALRQSQPRQLKIDLLEGHRPSDYRGDVWLLTERDADTRIDGSRNDHFVLRLNEHSGGGYLWNIDQLRQSGFVIIRDDRESTDHEGVGGPVVRHVTAGLELEEGQRGQLSLNEARPWQPSSPISRVTLNYDLTGPEETRLLAG